MPRGTWGYPVRCGASALSLKPRTTGSPAFAGDDSGGCRVTRCSSESSPHERTRYAGAVVSARGPGCRGAEPDDELANIGVSGRHTQIGIFRQPLDRRQDSRHCTARGSGIGLIQKSPQSLDIRQRLGRKNDHPILRGDGRGNSPAVSQLATHALTPSSETAVRLCRNPTSRRRSSATSGPARSTTESSNATASARTAAPSCPRSAAISVRRASVPASISKVRRMMFIAER